LEKAYAADTAGKMSQEFPRAFHALDNLAALVANLRIENYCSQFWEIFPNLGIFLDLHWEGKKMFGEFLKWHIFKGIFDFCDIKKKKKTSAFV